MNETEWLVCDDPAEMIRDLQPTRSGDASPIQAEGGQGGITDAQLRFWVEACREIVNDSRMVQHDLTSELKEAVVCWSTHKHSIPDLSMTTRCAILRDIVGNPWRPVMLPRTFGFDDAKNEICSVVDRSSWLTTTVLSLARAAHEERVARKCERCHSGKVVTSYEGTFWTRTDKPRNTYGPCPDCKGTGTFPSAELDRNRLLILADALEEAGVEDVPCPNCKDADFFVGDSGIPMMGGEEPYATRAKAYWNSKCICGGTRKTANPILAHLRGPGPHWRGCAVLTAILGES